MAERGRGAGYWLEDKAIRGLLGLALALPYETRVTLMGKLMSRVIAPLAGYDRRVREGLAHACPDLPEAEVRRLMRAVPDNVGRTIIESYSGAEFVHRTADAPLEGAGVAALEQCRAEGRPAVLVSGHFGNYDAIRAALIPRGFTVGGLYNPMKNAYFNAHYARAMGAIGQPIFPRGRQGLGGMVRFLRDGGMIGVIADQYMHHGAMLTFFDKPAPTALSSAELALKYDAMLVPLYGIRQENGLDFRVVAEAPVPHSDPLTMMQALNDSLEAQVRKHMDQWFWIHRRWKPERHDMRDDWARLEELDEDES